MLFRDHGSSEKGIMLKSWGIWEK